MDCWLVPGDNNQQLSRFHNVSSTLDFHLPVKLICGDLTKSLPSLSSLKHFNESLPELQMCEVSKYHLKSLRRSGGFVQRWILGCGLIFHLAMRPLTRHIKWKGNRKNGMSVYQTEVDYLVYSINFQGLIDNTGHCCRNHSIIVNKG